MEQDHIRRQQYDADAATLIYAGLRQVNHNLRPTASHEERNAQDNVDLSRPAFDMPTIVGRVLNGSTFEPIIDINVELRCNQELVPMRNTNWQNPYTISPITPGTFSFWPAPLPCETPDMHNIFQYSIRIDHPDYEPLTHFFNVAVVSKFSTPFYHLSNMDRTYKLPDLYIFPPGEAELNG
jgi:competence protein ComFB